MISETSQKAAVVVLGCPKNTVEAEYLLGILKSRDFELTPDVDNADVIIVHTCSFIYDARIESERCIRRMLRLKAGRDVKVFVTGCLTQLLGKKILDDYPSIDGYAGTGALHMVPDLFFNAESKDLLKAGGLNDSKHRILSSYLPSAYLKIAEGCNHKCSFCIIPGLRGKYRSRTVRSLVDEASALADAGVKELILVAQDTTSYGSDIYDSFALDRLLSGLAKIGGIRWIRLLYAYPSSITDRLLDVFKEYRNICGYMDIPIQHISRSVLARMGRPLNTRRIIEKIKNKLPGIFLRTSIITGFPGETDSDIEELADFIKQGYFLYAGVFEYSAQEKATSSKLPDAVEAAVAKSRRKMLENIQYGVFKSAVGQLKNVKTEFFAESCGKKDGKFLVRGRSMFQAPEIDGSTIVISPARINPGSFCDVSVKGCSGYNIKAEIKK